MNNEYGNGIPNSEPYIPSSLSEVYDLIALMILSAPTFVDRSGYFPEQDVHTLFSMLTQGFEEVRRKLGEERFDKLNDLATRAKALFAGGVDDSSGKADQARDLLFEIEEIIQDARSRRVVAKLKDEDGEVTGD